DFVRDSSAGTFGFGGSVYSQSSAAIAASADSYQSPGGIEPGYTTLELNANWTHIFGKPLDMNWFVTNVPDRVSRVGANSSFHASSNGNQSDFYAPPRMFGVTLTAHF